ncbi:MAG TPA: molybdopterin-dependent oxidoreductase, partial [Solirubrobacterales bacterium]|nr:molybdopterin-dependent oxidoreductase [Solirubrobacterales bacterium]
QRLMREALGSPHVESRATRGPDRATLLRLARPKLSARVRDIDSAEAILVVGTDPLHSSPILDLRIRKAMRRCGARLAVATERPTALDGGAEAAVRYAPGGATLFLSELAACLRLGSQGGAASPLAEVLRGAENVTIVWGERIGREGEGALRALLDVAAALGLAAKDHSGLLEIPEAANARGLREVGCLPDAGPGLVEVAAGKGTEGIRAALEAGELKTVVLFGVDPLRDFPDTGAWERALEAADRVIAFSLFENATTVRADVVLPLETHAEKDGTVTHPDGRLQRVRPSAARPGEVRAGRRVLADLCAALGDDTGVSSQTSALEALAEAVPFYAGIDDAEIGGRGVRWQDREAAAALPDAEEAAGTPSPGGQPGGAEPAEGVLALGTYRDLWAGPITELNPPLRFLEPEQRVELSPADAERLGLACGDEVTVSRNGTSLRAKVVLRERIADGACFLIEGVAEGNANALLNGGPAAVRIEKAAG